MAFERLDMLGQIWQGRGLNFLFRTEDVPSGFSLIASGQPKPIAKKPSESVNRTRPALRPPLKEPGSVQAQKKPVLEPLHWNKIDQKVWPKPWQDIFAKIRPGKLVWTYPELGADLLGLKLAGQDDRRKFFQNLFQNVLQYPPGTHTFWPYCLDPAQKEPVNMDLFWSGVRALGGRVVLSLGAEASQAIFNKTALYTNNRIDGFMGFTLPTIDALQQERAFKTFRGFIFQTVTRYFTGR